MTDASYFETQHQRLKKPQRAKTAKEKRRRKPKFPPDTDIELWLLRNAPETFEELVNLRYGLYHRCSSQPYKVDRNEPEDFELTGIESTLHIVSKKARHYLLWRLKALAKENRWKRAIPRTPIAGYRIQPKVGIA